MNRLDPGARRRLLGRHDTGRPGPTVVVVGGLHGNEPAGVLALRRVLDRLAAEALPLRGELWALSGNLRALAEDRRYLERDLNRRWSSEELSRLVNTGPDGPEDREQLELLELLAPLLLRAGPPVVFLDLHSTSGPATPFSCMADVLRNRGLALALPVPVVLGLEEVIDGSLLGYLCDMGHIGVAIEGGQHADPATVEVHETAVWIALVAAGALDAAALPDLAERRARLAALARGRPAVCEIRHRHAVRPEDEPFRMEPGFENFQPVHKGQLVARDARGPVLAPYDGLMMLPRYQGLGDDGFFVARAVSPLALGVSALLRRLRLDRAVPLLPGVRRDPAVADRYVADPRIARVRVVDVFHLFGYRHVRAQGERLLFSRRAPEGVRVVPPEVRALAQRAGR